MLCSQLDGAVLQAATAWTGRLACSCACKLWQISCVTCRLVSLLRDDYSHPDKQSDEQLLLRIRVAQASEAERGAAHTGIYARCVNCLESNLQVYICLYV